MLVMTGTLTIPPTHDIDILKIVVSAVPSCVVE